MPKEQLEEALLELHGRQDKTKKEVFELILKGISENRTLPDKKASIPDTRSMRKNWKPSEIVSRAGTITAGEVPEPEPGVI